MRRIRGRRLHYDDDDDDDDYDDKEKKEKNEMCAHDGPGEESGPT